MTISMIKYVKKVKDGLKNFTRNTNDGVDKEELVSNGLRRGMVRSH